MIIFWMVLAAIYACCTIKFYEKAFLKIKEVYLFFLQAVAAIKIGFYNILKKFYEAIRLYYILKKLINMVVVKPENLLYFSTIINFLNNYLLTTNIR